jgi:hypothetical protein
MCQSQNRCPQVDIFNVFIIVDFQIVFVLIYQVLRAPYNFFFKYFFLLDAFFEPLAKDNEAGNIS